MENRIKDYLSMLDRGRRIFFFSKVLFIILGYSFFSSWGRAFCQGLGSYEKITSYALFFILLIWFFSFEVSSLYKSHENNNDKK